MLKSLTIPFNCQVILWSSGGMMQHIAKLTGRVFPGQWFSHELVKCWRVKDLYLWTCKRRWVGLVFEGFFLPLHNGKLYQEIMFVSSLVSYYCVCSGMYIFSIEVSEMYNCFWMSPGALWGLHETFVLWFAFTIVRTHGTNSQLFHPAITWG